MNMTNRKQAPKPPYPDWDDEKCKKGSFHGLVWYPTVGLKFVERQVYVEEYSAAPATRRILQQQWETRIVNNAKHLPHIVNPYYTQWRDIPLETEEMEKR